ncbi:MAG: magnesium transporter [Parvularculaceae bacterium]|nr:magnesium transporter [Parvularculaceae bacterium]
MTDPTVLGEAPQRAAAATPFAEDGALSETFVAAVVEAVDSGRRDAIETLLEPLHPSDIAALLGQLNEDTRERFLEFRGDSLDAEDLGEVLAELSPDIVESVVGAFETEKVAEAVADLDTDDAAFALENLEAETRAEILAEMPAPERTAVNAALDYEEESAGRLMQREVMAAPGYWTVAQILERLRGADDLPHRFYEIFVVDPAMRPVGSIPLSALLRAASDLQLESLVEDREMRLIPVTMDQEEVAYLFEHYNLISAPVVDPDGRLAGMITVDDVVEIVHSETHEDMLALGGVEADTGLSDNVLTTVRSRFNWLSVNLLTAILASFVISLFDDAIGKFVALAVLMPIVASMGGNAGTQTLTVAVRSLATKDLTPSNAARIIWREALVGGVNGFLFALIIGFCAGVWYYATGGAPQKSLALAAVVGVAMIVNLLAAGLAGILVPLGLQRAGADPAVASAVFVTTVTDVVGFFVFLGLAAIVLV